MGKHWSEKQVESLKGFIAKPVTSRFKSRTGRLRVNKIASYFPNRTRGSIGAQLHKMRHSNSGMGTLKRLDFDVMADGLIGGINELRKLYHAEHSKNGKVADIVKQLLTA